MNIVMMGIQGSGKGTQSKLLAAALKLPHVSTGDLFRDNLSRGTELGERAKEFMRARGMTDEQIEERLQRAGVDPPNESQ